MYTEAAAGTGTAGALVTWIRFTCSSMGPSSGSGAGSGIRGLTARCCPVTAAASRFGAEVMAPPDTAMVRGRGAADTAALSRSSAPAAASASS